MRRAMGLALLLPLLCGFDLFHTSNRHVEEGNAKLGAGKVKEALEDYQRAAKELPDEAGVHYNLGIAQLKLGQADKAREALVKATLSADPTLKAKSFYNLGNAQFEGEHYQEAVSAYTRALQLDPGHRAAKWNLELALRRLEEKKKEQEKKQQEQDEQQKDKEQQEQQDKDQQDKQQKDQQQKDQQEKNKEQEQQDQQQQDKEQQEQQDKDQQDKQQPQPQQDPDKPQPQPDPQQKERQQMQSVLDALDRNDKNLQRQRLRQLQGQGLHRPSKDW